MLLTHAAHTYHTIIQYAPGGDQAPETDLYLFAHLVLLGWAPQGPKMLNPHIGEMICDLLQLHFVFNLICS